MPDDTGLHEFTKYAIGKKRYDESPEFVACLTEVVVRRMRCVLGEIFMNTGCMLFAHQLKGLAWNLATEESNACAAAVDPVGGKDKYLPRGGLCFDEMGMGKTLKFLATALSDEGQTLVIALSTVLLSWIREGERVMGEGNFSYDVLTDVQQLYPRKPNAKIIMTTYENFKRPHQSGNPNEFLSLPRWVMYDRVADRTFKPKVWRRVIIDEAHYIRNSKTVSSKNIRRIKADIVWTLTGTPINNRLADMVSLWDTVCGGDMRCATSYQRHMWRCTAKSIGLRMVKLDKTVTFIDMTEPGKRIVDELWRCFCQAAANEKLPYLTAMRMASVDPLLLYSNVRCKGAEGRDEEHGTWGDAGDGEGDGAYWQREGDGADWQREGDGADWQRDGDGRAGEEINIFKIRGDLVDPSSVPTEAEVRAAGTLSNGLYVGHMVKGLMDHIATHDKKSIVFTRYRGELDSVRTALQSMGIECRTLDGRNVDCMTRKYDIAAFCEGNVRVLVMQVLCGGVGLNLQAAKVVYFLSPDYNPCNDQQAVARAYRTGQTDDVKCIYFVAKTMVERMIFQLQARKTDKSRRAIGEGTINIIDDIIKGIGSKLDGFDEDDEEWGDDTSCAKKARIDWSTGDGGADSRGGGAGAVESRC